MKTWCVCFNIPARCYEETDTLGNKICDILMENRVQYIMIYIVE